MAVTYGTLGEKLQHLFGALVLGGDSGDAGDEGEREVEGLHFGW